MKSKEIKSKFVEYIYFLPDFLKRKFLRKEKVTDEVFLLFREYLQYMLEEGKITIRQWDDMELDDRTYKRVMKILEKSELYK